MVNWEWCWEQVEHRARMQTEWASWDTHLVVEIEKGVIAEGRLSVQEQVELAETGSLDQVRSLAVNPYLDFSCQGLLAVHPDLMVRRILASNHVLHACWQEELAMDVGIYRELAHHAHLAESLQERLMQEETSILCTLGWNASLTSRHCSTLARSPHSEVRYSVAGNPSLGRTDQAMLSFDPNDRVVWRLRKSLMDRGGAHLEKDPSQRVGNMLGADWSVAFCLGLGAWEFLSQWGALDGEWRGLAEGWTGSVGEFWRAAALLA